MEINLDQLTNTLGKILQLSAGILVFLLIVIFGGRLVFYGVTHHFSSGFINVQQSLTVDFKKPSNNQKDKQT